MVKFNRYPHVEDIMIHYLSQFEREDIVLLLSQGLNSTTDAEVFANFVWDVVEAINDDEENNVSVLGSSDNTEMLPDISYEVTKLMKDNGFYQVWQKVSSEQM